MTLILGDPVPPWLVHSLPGLSQTPTLRSPGDHMENPMDRGAWWAIVRGFAKRVRHNLVTKQQERTLKPKQVKK